jgi:proteasome lid subunit RPN8/RPN11
MTGDRRLPTADFIIIPSYIFDEMIAYSKECYPNEACGILAGKDNEVLNIYKMKNIENSPVTYMLDSKEQFKVMKEIRQNNLSMLAIFHSHPSSAAFPSQRDIELAFYEDVVYIIISLMGNEAVVKGYLIKSGEVKEVSLHKK